MTGRDREFMLRAIELARRGEPTTFPNPPVGAVVVKKGRIVGEGYHKKAGAPHAEIIALRKAGKNTKGARLYVSLEPCAHYGRTPPCVRSIKKSGIKKVYLAMNDPNPLVSGKGADFLRKSGIAVNSGICRREARRLNRSYIDRIEAKGVYGNS
jgi:diaminohydroxyphosphoribosylaminopyrimidine deaminase/5-amino-6-(5-phosphoribosylamino)uracil reductase